MEKTGGRSSRLAWVPMYVGGRISAKERALLMTVVGGRPRFSFPFNSRGYC